MPKNTTPAATERKRLLSSRPPSRLSGANSPLSFSAGARTANKASEPPMAIVSSINMKIPRAGSLAKACTELSTPERTRNVPIRLKEKAMMASSTVQIFRASRFSTTRAECNRALPASQGMNEAFSTGSQDHHPPQPSS